MAQPPSGGLSWPQAVGSGIGVVLVLALGFGVLRLKHLRMAARKERPPLKEKLLRPPGYSLYRRIDDVSDRLLLWALQAMVSGALFGLVAGAFYPLVEALALQRVRFAAVWSQPGSHVLISAACIGLAGLLWTVRSIAGAVQAFNEIENCRFGLRGEQAVAEALAVPALATAGYVTFHDVPGDGAWNIDHVVVGPGGVFVLETKTRSRRKATRQLPEHEVRFDGRTLAFPWCDDTSAADQVTRNADWIRKLVVPFAPEDLFVQPIIVVPGWYVVNTQANQPVLAMNCKYLVGYLTGLPKRLTEEQLRPILARIEERCRTLEF